MIGSAELVLFAIQAGVRMAHTGRKIYVENTAQGGTMIPLPPGLQSPLSQAQAYARLLRDQIDTERYNAVFKENYERSRDTNLAANERENAAWGLITLYLNEGAQGRVSEISPTGADQVALGFVTQWKPGHSPFPHPMQRVAGTLVETAVDYFVHMPGAINENSRQGKLIKAFLTGLDDFDFQTARWDDMAVALFTAALDVMSANAALLTGDESENNLTTLIMKGVAEDVKTRLTSTEFGDLDKEARLKAVGQTVLRSLLRTSGEAAMGNPSYLGVKNPAGRALVQSVGGAFISILMGDEGEDIPLTEGLRNLASTGGLDKLMQAALRVAVENPDAFSFGGGTIDKWLKKVLQDLFDRGQADGSFFDANILTDVAYSLLKNGAEEFPSMLKASAGNKALLVDVAQNLLAILADPPSDGKPARWKIANLSKTDVVTFVDKVTKVISEHPEWVSGSSGVQKALRTILPVAMGIITDGDKTTLKNLIRGDGLEALLFALVNSGLIKEISGDNRDKIIKGIKAVRKAIESDGQAGLKEALTPEFISDLMKAAIGSNTIDRLWGDDAAEVRAAANAVVKVVREARNGKVLAVPEIIAMLQDPNG